MKGLDRGLTRPAVAGDSGIVVDDDGNQVAVDNGATTTRTRVSDDDELEDDQDVAYTAQDNHKSNGHHNGNHNNHHHNGKPPLDSEPIEELPYMPSSSLWWRLTSFVRHYLVEGQYIAVDEDETLRQAIEDERREGITGSIVRSWLFQNFVRKRPKYVAVFLPLVIVWAAWFTGMFVTDAWYLFKENYFMTITMFFASIVAGATSEGGGAIAFPVMTLFFKIQPVVARDMSLMTQSVGMTGATFTHVYQRIRVERNTLLFATCGGAFGTVFGLQWVAPHLPPPESKMVFVSVWLGFAGALFFLNTLKEREVHLEIPNFCNWKACVLMGFGFLGGILTSAFGSGLDICTFSCLTLLFRVSEKTATPTTVILQAVNSLIAVGFKLAFMDGMEWKSVEYWAVSVPVLVIGAPMGAFLSSFAHRLVLGVFIYVADTAQFIAALIIVPLDTFLIVLVVCIIFFSIVLFASMTKLGGLLLVHDLKQIEEEKRKEEMLIGRFKDAEKGQYYDERISLLQEPRKGPPYS